MTGRGGKPQGVLYLLHFSEPYKHARHYTGFAHSSGFLKSRLADHEAGRGARLLQVAKAAGITWTLARTWPGDRTRERQLKNQGGASRRCPECGVKPRTPSAEPKDDIAAMKQPKDKQASPPPGTRPPEYVVETWVSKQLRDRIQRAGPSLAEALQAPGTQAPVPDAELEAEP